MRVVSTITLGASKLREVREGRYLIVGVINTVVGYVSFALALAILGDQRYIISLAVSHLVGTTLAFILYRRFVFRVRGRLVIDYLRFQLVYVGAFFSNLVLLAVLVDVVSMPILLAQAAALIVLALLTYWGHRFFSFSRNATRHGAD